MKTISANLNSHLGGETLTIATCWKVTREDGQIFGFTDHDEDLVVSSVPYKASTGFSGSAIETTGDLAVDNLETAGFLDATTLTQADLMAGVWDYAIVDIFVVNYKAIGDGTLILRKGRLGEVRMTKARFFAELRGIAQALSQTIGEVYTPGCRADVFDARCGLSGAAYQVNGTVTHVVSTFQAFRDANLTEADDYFRGGKVLWLSGSNDGREMEVRAHAASNDQLTLVLGMVQPIQVGDTFRVWPGCDKTEAHCKTKFAVNNIVNFRGEPLVAGFDRMFSRQ